MAGTINKFLVRENDITRKQGTVVRFPYKSGDRYIRSVRSGDRQNCCRETALPFPDCRFLTRSFFKVA
ncbi:hypothetical protein QUB08_25840 [Microcoleus sp. BR0-C5]|uniref:hypothetical protein n=1 Tax=Microcoleus sp. BR0-C5 TaxID=2818713 RepID=UPI002FD70FBC